MSLADPAFESNVIALLKGIYDNIGGGGGLPYTSVSGTFYQRASDDSVVINELYNNSPYELSINGNVGGQIIFSTDLNSELSKTLIFLGPPSHYGCTFQIQNDNDDPIVIVVSSVNAINDSLDPRGFGSNGNDPISFEIRFYP
jgi:hypothetical protein